MGRKSLISWLAGAVFAASAMASPPDLAAAIDAYLADDFSQMHIIERHALANDPVALGTLGQACYYGLGCARDRVRAVSLMTRAAEAGDLPSMVQLGRIYEHGTSGIPADTALSARWFLRAAEAGDTISAPGALSRLPRDVVIAEGGSAWLEAGSSALAPPDVPRLANDLPTEPGPAPEMALSRPPSPSPSLPAQTPPVAPAPETGARSYLTASLAGVSAGVPAPLRLSDGTAFPIYVSTRMGPRGDAAASCTIDLDPAIETKVRELEALAALAKSQDGVSRASTIGRFDVLKAEVRSMLAAQRAARETFDQIAGLNGITRDDINLAFSFHVDAGEARPETGPGAELCRRHFVILDAELIALEARE